MNGVYLFDKGDIEQILRRSVNTVCYFGITWSDDYIYIGESFNKNQQSRIIILNKRYKKIGVILLRNFYDVHQIIYHEEILYICNTGKNNALLYSTKDCCEIGQINFGSVRKDINHVNSVWIKDNSLFFTFLNKKDNFQSAIKEYDLDSFELIKEIKVGDGIHNVYEEDDVIYTCSSHSKQMMMVKENESKTYDFSSDTWFWLRGMAVCSEGIIVGGSQIKNRKHRKFIKKNMIYYFDFDLNLIDKFKIEMDMCGPIYDIRLLNGDKSHNGMNL
jgi:hypothetical protein